MDQPLADIGIISAYRFSNDGSATKLDVANLDAELADPNGWLWLHFNLSNRRCHDWLARRAPLSDVARETLLDADEHIRLDIFGEEIAGILPDLHRSRAGRRRSRTGTLCDLVEADDHRPAQAAARDQLTRRALDGGRKFRTPVSLFDAIVDQFADVIGHYSAGLGEDLDIVENHVLHDEIDDERLRLGRVRLQAIRTRRQLSQIRALFHRMETREDVKSEALLSAMRKLAQIRRARLRVQRDLERARLLQDEIAGRMTAITNRRLFTLSVLTACMLPSTLVTGFFGMNTNDMPFQSGEGGTWYALLLVIAAGALTWWLLRRTKAL